MSDSLLFYRRGFHREPSFLLLSFSFLPRCLTLSIVFLLLCFVCLSRFCTGNSVRFIICSSVVILCRVWSVICGLSSSEYTRSVHLFRYIITSVLWIMTTRLYPSRIGSCATINRPITQTPTPFLSKINSLGELDARLLLSSREP